MILSHPERLLLETVRGPAHRRQAAWEERRRLYPLTSFPNPAAQLLSLVAGDWPDQQDEQSALRRILEDTRLSNQSKMDIARRLGNEIVWLGDLALLLGCYASAGHRPIDALEGWVTPVRLETVSRQLEQQGLPVIGRVRGAVFHECPKSATPVRLLTPLLPNRSNPAAPPERWVEDLRLLAPENLLLRLCLARPHNAWWVADLLTLVPLLDSSTLGRETARHRASLSVRRTIRRINLLGFEQLECDLSATRVFPGEWFESMLGERPLTAHLLTSVDDWRQLPAALWAYLRAAWERKTPGP